MEQIKKDLEKQEDETLRRYIIDKIYKVFDDSDNGLIGYAGLSYEIEDILQEGRDLLNKYWKE